MEVSLQSEIILEKELEELREDLSVAEWVTRGLSISSFHAYCSQRLSSSKLRRSSESESSGKQNENQIEVMKVQIDPRFALSN